MRILVINWQDKSHPQSGGAESHLHSIFSRIAAKGHHVTLLCCGHGKAPHREICDGINIVRIGRRPWFNYIVPLWWTLVGKGLKFDIVIDDINKLPFFTPGLSERFLFLQSFTIFLVTVFISRQAGSPESMYCGLKNKFPVCMPTSRYAL